MTALPLRDRKAALLRAVRELSAARPEGWDVAALSAQLGSPPDDEPRLRRFVLARLRDGVLRRVGRGEFAAGTALDDDLALGVGVALVEEVAQALRDAGGVLSLSELLIGLGRAEAGERLVRSVLTQSARFVAGTPWPGLRQVWRLTEVERASVPLPGRLMRFELLMLLDAMPGLCKKAPWDIVEPLAAMRARVGGALSAACDLAGLGHAELAAAPGVTSALAWAVRSSSVGWTTPDGSRSTLSRWWSEVAATGGDVAAAEAALRQAELDDEPHVLQSFTVPVWVALGDALNLDAAALSRGWLKAGEPR